MATVKRTDVAGCRLVELELQDAGLTPPDTAD
jgi:hypothetical protein